MRWLLPLGLLLMLGLPVSALPPPLPKRLRHLSAEVQATVRDVHERCSCQVKEEYATEFYPNCLPLLNSSNRQHCIPRIIHQTSKEAFPPARSKLFHLSWRYLNVGWTLLLWSDADVLEWMQENYGWFVEVFRTYENPVQRADAFRYFVLHAYGGVYADLDYEATKPLETYVDFFNRPLAFVCPGSWSSSISNSLMMSRYCPNLWEPLLGRLNTSAASSKEGFWGLWPGSRVMSSTGPTFLRLWLEKERPSFVCRLPRQQFSPCDYCTPGCKLTDGVLAIHHYARSWNNWDIAMVNLFVCYWSYVLALCLCIVVLRTQRHIRVYVWAIFRSYMRFLCRIEMLYIMVAFAVTWSIAHSLPS